MITRSLRLNNSFCIILKQSLDRDNNFSNSSPQMLQSYFARIHQYNLELYLDERSLAAQLNIYQRLKQQQKKEISDDMKEVLEKLIEVKVERIIELPTILKLIQFQRAGDLSIDKDKFSVLIKRLCEKFKGRAQYGFCMDGYLLNSFYGDLLALCKLVNEETQKCIEDLYISSFHRMSLTNTIKFIHLLTDNNCTYSPILMERALQSITLHQEFVNYYAFGLAVQVYLSDLKDKEVKKQLKIWIEESVRILDMKSDRLAGNEIFVQFFQMHEYAIRQLQNYSKMVSGSSISKILRYARVQDV